MKKGFVTLLATMIFISLYGKNTLASLTNQCRLEVPVYNQPLVNNVPDNQLITINSDTLNAKYFQNILFSGNVYLKKGNTILTANKVELNKIRGQEKSVKIGTVIATGSVHYSSPKIMLSGPKIWLDLDTQDIDVYQGHYQMIDRQGRGTANTIKLRGINRYTIIKDGTFTSCLVGDNSWNIVGSEVFYDRIEQVAKVWGARFYIGGVAVFYSPYIQFPIGEKRRSGFLIPNVKYGNKNGIEFILPYYWNIASNYDVTIIPHYISRRGLQWRSELRYMMQPGSGLITLDWLLNDKQYKENQSNNNNRWLFHWNHNSLMDQVWRFNIDFTKVSDSKYFTDLDSKYGSTTNGYAIQKLSFGYGDENFDANLSTKQFQIFDNTDFSYFNSYKVWPQLDINYYINHLNIFYFHLYSQMARFDNPDLHSPKAIRLHLEPTLSLPLINRWVTLNIEAKMLASHYQQKIPNSFAIHYVNRNSNNDFKAIAPYLDNSLNRILPQFKIDGKLMFERKIGLTRAYTQTLESRTQYLYVPYQDQSNIYNYDTTLLQKDYFGLFRNRTYSGLDYIPPYNRISSGLTTRIYDNMLVERFNASVGQIYYVKNSKERNYRSTYNNSDSIGGFEWAGDTYWKIDEYWSLYGSLQYNTRLHSLSLANGTLGYQQDLERIVQLNYRFATPKYIQTVLNTNNIPTYQNGIAQMGLTGSWAIADRWAMVGMYYYNTHDKKFSDQWVGLKYNTCCWSVTLGYERKLTDWNKIKKIRVYENKISFNIKLRGLSNDYSLGSEEMLRSGILPYQYAF